LHNVPTFPDPHRVTNFFKEKPQASLHTEENGKHSKKAIFLVHGESRLQADFFQPEEQSITQAHKACCDLYLLR
jgi:hypothetical protein